MLQLKRPIHGVVRILPKAGAVLEAQSSDRDSELRLVTKGRNLPIDKKFPESRSLFELIQQLWMFVTAYCQIRGRPPPFSNFGRGSNQCDQRGFDRKNSIYHRS